MGRRSQPQRNRLDRGKQQPLRPTELVVKERDPSRILLTPNSGANCFFGGVAWTSNGPVKSEKSPFWENPGTVILLAVRPWLVLVTLLVAGSTAAAQVPSTGQGVPPQSARTCPITHPIKGNFTPVDPRAYCIYHVPGGQFYQRTKPERCYERAAAAEKDGCRRSKV